MPTSITGKHGIVRYSGSKINPHYSNRYHNRIGYKINFSCYSKLYIHLDAILDFLSYRL